MRGPPQPSPADSLFASQAFKGVLSQYLRQLLKDRPDIALQANQTITGVPSPLLGLEDRQRLRANLRLANELADVDPRALDPWDYASYQTVRWELDMVTEAQTFGDLDFSVLSPARTPLRDAIAVLLNHPTNSAGDLERYLYLVEGLGFWFEDARAALGERARRGNLPSREAVEDFARFLERFRVLETRGSLRVADARLTGLDSAGVNQFREFEREALELRVRPQVDSLVRFLSGEYRLQAAPRPGLWQLPGGKEFYRHLLRRNLGLEVTPEEAHAAGLSMLRRIDSLKTVWRGRAGWSKSDIEYLQMLRRLEEFAPVPMDTVLARVTATIQVARDSSGGRLSPARDSIVVREATDLEALFSPDGLVVPPPFADSATTLAITPAWTTRAALVEGRSRALRWGWPGRAMGAARSYGADSVSPLIIVHPAQTTVAGWGEYAASLGGEMRLYIDPLAAYGRLMQEGLAAAWLVVDTGVHYFGWGKPQALAVLRLNSLATDAELDSMFTARVIQDPGSAGSEAIGLREFSAMRAWMQKRLGPSFNAAEWHRELLSLGPLPLPVLAAHLEWWAWDKQQREARAAREAREALKRKR